MSSKKQLLSRIGIASKGTIYVIIGILTVLSALQLGGKVSGSRKAIRYFVDLPFGKVLLIILALGLLCYCFWEFYRAYINADDIKANFIGYATRISYALGGLFYLFLAYFTLSLILDFDSVERKSYDIYNFINQNEWVGYIIALVFAGKGVFEIYRAFSNRFKERIHVYDLSDRVQKSLMNWAKFGITSRGIVFLVMGFISYEANSKFHSGNISRTSEAFGYIKNLYGELFLAVIAVGFIGFGLFQFVKARYLYIRAHKSS
ncbi:DUF1206 domain-containing protein [Winogradskyella maritima]|uniref:DUF1206 domain-containing protein n=1 Tax=Winogradskyella maritima TaxID=1517766 RepID=A0ABV8AF68_9FLAO|nr:DUF1206 domain-containing protein [Winogradskyella maritima]